MRRACFNGLASSRAPPIASVTRTELLDLERLHHHVEANYPSEHIKAFNFGIGRRRDGCWIRIAGSEKALPVP